jgi:hypothetical protein
MSNETAGWHGESPQFIAGRTSRKSIGTSVRTGAGPKCLSVPHGQQAPVIVVTTVADTIGASAYL